MIPVKAAPDLVLSIRNATTGWYRNSIGVRLKESL